MTVNALEAKLNRCLNKIHHGYAVKNSGAYRAVSIG